MYAVTTTTSRNRQTYEDTMNALSIPRIEQTGGVAWAVITQDGIAVYSDSEDAVSAVLTGDVDETAEDWMWYQDHGPWYFCEELTARIQAT